MDTCYYCGKFRADDSINDDGGPEFGEAHYFCSVSCKNKYINAQRAKNPNFKTGEEKKREWFQYLVIAFIFPIVAIKWIVGALKEPELPKKVFKLVGTCVLLVLWFIIMGKLVSKKPDATSIEPATSIELEAPTTETTE